MLNCLLPHKNEPSSQRSPDPILLSFPDLPRCFAVRVPQKDCSFLKGNRGDVDLGERGGGRRGNCDRDVIFDL